MCRKGLFHGHRVKSAEQRACKWAQRVRWDNDHDLPPEVQAREIWGQKPSQKHTTGKVYASLSSIGSAKGGDLKPIFVLNIAKGTTDPRVEFILLK